MMEREQGQIVITRVQPDTHFTPGASPQPGYRVEFTTPSGIRSNVTVPRSESLPEDVQAAVQHESDLIEAAARSHTYRPSGAR